MHECVYLLSPVSPPLIDNNSPATVRTNESRKEKAMILNPYNLRFLPPFAIGISSTFETSEHEGDFAVLINANHAIGYYIKFRRRFALDECPDVDCLL
jgi:hypothetical protein